MRPMLAKEYDWQHLPYMFIVQPKLRGIRGVLHEGRVYSRDERHLAILDGKFPVLSVTLDGELYVHGWTQHRIQGAINRSEPSEDTRHIEFHAFDSIELRVPQFERIAALKSLLEHPFLKVVPSIQEKIDSSNQTYNHFLLTGYEGAIYRDPNAFYEPGIRSWALMKRKPFITDECICKSVVVSRNGKRKGLLKHLVCDWNGKTILLGGGNMSSDDLKTFVCCPPIGRRVTFKYQYLSAYGRPQCPQFYNLTD